MKKLCAVLLALCFVLSACSGAGSEQQNGKKESNGEERITVGFLPLDTRPCCMDIPAEIAEVAGVDVIMPSRDILVDFKETPDLEGVRAWLSETAGQCDALVISMEQLVYGGLVQARAATGDTQGREDAIAFLRSIKEQYPDLPVYASNVLMRTSPTVFNQNEDQIWWEKINEYSQVLYEADVQKDEDAARRVTELENEIPQDILEAFFQAREANHELNLNCIELVKEGVIDKLKICQEDCPGVGIQISEQEELNAEIQKNGLEEKISMSNGTDEAGAEIMMCVACPEGCDIQVVWLGDNTDFVPLYEDRPFEENLKEHTDFMNISMSETSDNVVCILPPLDQQGDYAEDTFDNYTAYSEDEMDSICDQIKTYTEEKERCYILDLDCANGGTVNLLTTLGQKMDISALAGYSGWNTACNSLGTLLAQVLATQNGNTALNQTFTAERILDEAIYQSSVRLPVYEKCEQKGLNADKLHVEDVEEVEAMIADEFAGQKGVLEDIFGDDVPNFQTGLRWNRIFEILVSVTG